MEERLEEAGTSAPLSSPHSWEDMGSLVLWCRNAAALQPDGTRVPVVRCEVGVFLAQCSSACRLAGIEVPQDLIGSVAMFLGSWKFACSSSAARWNAAACCAS